MDIPSLIKKHQLISDQIEPVELRIILELLEQTIEAGIAGDVVEFGCYAGTTSLFIQRLLIASRQRQKLHVYDSFLGLPEKSTQDQSAAGTQFRPGELAATKAELILNFKKAGLPLPYIHKSWFEDLSSQDIPARIAFAFLDGDYYESILTPLKLIWPRLSPGAIVVVDDYQNEALPGASRAVDAWLKDKPNVHMHAQSSLGVMILPAS